MRYLLSCLLVLVVGCSSPTSTQPAPRSGGATAQVSVIVLDSIGGTPVSGASVTVVDVTASQTLGSYTVGSDGYLTGDMTLSLNVGDQYNITASSSGRASSEMAGYVPSDGATVGLYCHTLGITGASALSPTLAPVLYSTDGTNWSTLSAGLTVSGPFEVQIGVYGLSAVLATAWSGFGIGLDLDQMPTEFDGIQYNYPSLITSLQSAVAQPSGGPYPGEFLTQETFNLMPLQFLPGVHVLDIVSYDVANNRVETRIPFTLK